MSDRNQKFPRLNALRWGALLFSPMLVIVAAAQSPLSADEAVQLGLKQNPQVIAAKAGVESAYSNYRSLGALPPITFSASHVQGTSTAPTLNGTNNDNIIDFGESFDFSGQRRYGAANANALFMAAQFTYQETLLTLEQQIRDAYWSLAAAQAQTKIADVSFKEAKRVYDLTIQQEKSGASPRGDVIRSSIDVANAKQILFSAKGAERTALVGFNNLLARSPSIPEVLSVDLAESGALPETQLPELKQLIEQSVKNRPLLKAAQEQTHAANYTVKQAEASRFPDLSVDYQRSTTQSIDTVIFSASIPVFDFGSITHQIRAARESRKQAEALQEQTRQQIEQQVATAYSDFQVAEQSAADYKREILDPSITLLSMAQLGYQQGATGILPVIDAESTIRNARVGYINSLLAVYKAQDEILAATGVLPKALK